MKRGLILVVACLAVGGLCASAVWGQEARIARKPTLAERMATLRDSFTRSRSAKSSQRGGRRSSPAASHTSQRRQAIKVKAVKPQEKATGSVLPRVQPSDLLPSRLLSHQGESFGPTAGPSTISTPRVGSAQLARRSPPPTRSSELESALEDLLDSTAGRTDDNPESAPPIAAETAPVTEQVVDTVSPIYEIDEADEADETDQEMPPENQPDTTAADSTAQPADQVVETQVTETPVTETPVTESLVAESPVTENQSPIRLQPAESNPTFGLLETLLATLPEEASPAAKKPPVVAEPFTTDDETPTVVAETPAAEEAAEQVAPQIAQPAVPKETPVEAPEETFVEVPAPSSEDLLVEAPVEADPLLPSHSEGLAGIEQQTVSREQLALEIAVEAELESTLLAKKTHELAKKTHEVLQKQQIALEERIAAAIAIMAAERAEQAQVEATERETAQRQALQEEFSDSETTTENLPVEHPGEQDVPFADEGPPPLPTAIATDAGEEQGHYAMESKLSRPSRAEAVGQPAADQIAPPMALTHPAAEEDEQLLFSHQEPAIVSRVEGPRKILVGREANYRVTVQNNGGTAAHDLESNIRVPAWAKLVGLTASQGTVQRIEQSDNSVTLLWQLQDLQAHGSQTLQLKLIPKDSRALQLGVQWSRAPDRAGAVVGILEPRLQIDLSGPNEAIYGKPVRYRLTLSNTGSAPAENVAVLLVPFGDLEKSISDHRFGRLLPGERKEVELELIAREAGELVMRAKAIAEGGLEAEAIKTVTCLKPELLLDWRGPQTKYAGTPATYYFRVYNPGSTSTDPLEVNLQLPIGVDFLAASKGFSRDSRRGAITWRLTGLEPKEERFLQVRCNLNRPGVNELLISAQTARGDLRENTTILTNVIAVADLKLDVSDPKGPLPVGEIADYLIRVQNRGNSTARGINVVAMFSEGIDPTSVEGARYTMRDGRVTFQTIESLQAGSEVVLRIRAEASQSGTHIFRTEVYCQDLDIKLSAEETTRFFLDENPLVGQHSPQSAGRAAPVWR